MKKVFLAFFLFCSCLCFVSCSEISDSSIQSKLKGDWVAYKVVSYLDGKERNTNYNGLVYSLSFKDNNTVEVVSGTYDSDDGWELDGYFGYTTIGSYYVEDGVVHVGFFFGDEQFVYEKGMLVLTEQEYEYGTHALEETIVHYKKK